MTLKLIECPRDAMQGIATFIPTQTKVKYIQQLLAAGFDTIDFGSFVSPKAIPQMQDTAAVIDALDLSATHAKLLAIVANTRGAEQAIAYNQIQYIGFPFSISETFQLRNTNQTILQAFDNVKAMQELCTKHNKSLVVYFSMGFGNPYGDVWNAEIVEHWAVKMNDLGIRIIALSDTTGVSNPENIGYLFSSLVSRYRQIEFGAHLHTTPDTWQEKIQAAYQAGCRRFDGAIKGFGGCPMAADKLTGNMPTEKMLSYFESNQIETGINKEAFNTALQLSAQIFSAH
jgi:hydroxymethylglutaryl-CoA lyase